MRRAALFFLPTLLPLAAFCFALGVTLPLLRIDRFYFLRDEPSLIVFVWRLWAGGDLLLAALVGLFSLVLPAVKLVLLNASALGLFANGTPPAWLHALSRWSMLDVLLVAIVIFAARTSGFASASTLPGLWFFAASVGLTAVASLLTRKLPASAGAPAQSGAPSIEDGPGDRSGSPPVQ